MDKVLRFIDKLSDKSGKVVAFLVVALVLIIFYEIVSRYVFNEPTKWVHQSSGFLLCTMAFIGGAYTLYIKSHISVDIFYARFPLRTKAALDLFTWLLFYLFIGVLLWNGSVMFGVSLDRLENSNTTWGPPMYPAKFTVALGAFLLLLQGLAKLVRDIVTVATGRGAA